MAASGDDVGHARAHALHPHGGHPHRDLPPRAGQRLHEGVQVAQVGHGQRQHGDGVIPRGGKPLLETAEHAYGRTLAVGAVDHARLAETAAPRAAAGHLHSEPVVHDGDIGDHRAAREGSLIEVGQDAAPGPDPGPGPVDPLQLGHALRAPGQIKAHLCHLGDDLLAVSEHHQVEEVHKGRWIGGAGAARDHDGVAHGASTGVDRDAGQLEHAHHRRIGEFVEQGKAQQIEIPDRAVLLECGELDPLALHVGSHVVPGREDPLGPNRVHAVKDLVEDLDAGVRHPDLVDVWKGQRHPHPDRLRVLERLVHLAAQVAAGFFDVKEVFVRTHADGVTPGPDGVRGSTCLPVTMS